ncbi:MAG: type II toxin-antitoxin system VapC family toxin [Pseudomonadota bacterium]
MTFVIDASVALRWFLNEPGADDAKTCFDRQQGIAPDFALAEIGNGLWRAHRRGRIELSKAKAFVTLSTSLYREIVPQIDLQQRSFEIACALDHAIYDCCYLALAEMRRVPFFTVDMTLREKVLPTQWRNLVSVLTP